jgi:LPS-assembly protein
VGETSITTDPLLFPQSNQLTFGGGYGSTNRKGWNVTGTDLYDLLLHRNVFQFLTTTYNTNCCGFGLQYRRINFGIRDENQYLFSFSLANLGTFGSLPKQSERF